MAVNMGLPAAAVTEYDMLLYWVEEGSAPPHVENCPVLEVPQLAYPLGTRHVGLGLLHSF